MGGRNTFRQGIAQTVHESFMGVDTRTGVTRSQETSGFVTGKTVHRIAELHRNGSGKKASDEHLLPIFNEDREVVAYERSLKADMLEGLNQDTHMGRMLGVWMGRVFEEETAEAFNAELIGVLKEIHRKGVADGEEDQFVNVADPKTPDAVVRDAWNTLGWRVRQQAFEAFGYNNLPIRKDMLNDAVGFRAARRSLAWLPPGWGLGDLRMTWGSWAGSRL